MVFLFLDANDPAVYRAASTSDEQSNSSLQRSFRAPFQFMDLIWKSGYERQKPAHSCERCSAAHEADKVRLPGCLIIQICSGVISCEFGSLLLRYNETDTQLIGQIGCFEFSVFNVFKYSVVLVNFWLDTSCLDPEKLICLVFRGKGKFQKNKTLHPRFSPFCYFHALQMKTTHNTRTCLLFLAWHLNAVGRTVAGPHPTLQIYHSTNSSKLKTIGDMQDRQHHC